MGSACSTSEVWVCEHLTWIWLINNRNDVKRLSDHPREFLILFLWLFTAISLTKPSQVNSHRSNLFCLCISQSIHSLPKRRAVSASVGFCGSLLEHSALQATVHFESNALSEPSQSQFDRKGISLFFPLSRSLFFSIVLRMTSTSICARRRLVKAAFSFSLARCHFARTCGFLSLF